MRREHRDYRSQHSRSNQLDESHKVRPPLRLLPVTSDTLIVASSTRQQPHLSPLLFLAPRPVRARMKVRVQLQPCAIPDSASEVWHAPAPYNANMLKSEMYLKTRG